MDKYEITRMLVDVIAAVMLICIPVLTRCATQYVKRMVDQYEKDSNNKHVAMLLREIADSVQTAVTTVNQVYVDAIKNSDQPFTHEAQEEAFKKAYKIALSLLSEDAKKYIRQTYESLENYLTVNIEAEVHNQKKGISTAQLMTAEAIL